MRGCPLDSDAFLHLLEALHEEFMREVVQAVRKQSNYDAIMAVGGIDAVERIARRVKLTAQQPFALKRPICRAR